MSRTEPPWSRRAALAVAALAALAMSAVAASGAGAAGAEGSAALALANHSKGRTLSGQGVKLQAGAPASLAANQLTLPVTALELGAKPAAGLNGGFAFSKGGRTVAVTGIRIDVASGSLVGRVEGSEMPIFRLGAAVSVDVPAGSFSLREGKLRLTPAAAKLLRRKLALKRALVHKGVGMIWVLAQAERPATAGRAERKPAEPTGKAVAVTAGSLAWGVLASWRSYVYANMGPGSVGTITLGEGATASGPLQEASSFVELPATGGSYERRVDGDLLSLRTEGSVTFAKPGHCIVEVRLSELEVKLDGANSALVSNGKYDIDRVEGGACADEPAVSLPGLRLAELDASAVAPTYSADGRTITWSGIPAKLTEAATSMFGGNYPAGKELDPVTIAVTTG